ncbi:peptide-methionine (S)-S-oxide reductase MsrA [Dyadobacter chenwenxiniae]|uniref:Peptide methionine sulfoxide reductase MsrA n=1 Tax=Dyadobacter chenwenxiniae TaxID=2906456 RepID=A0A9X1PSL0_9BACT|nr:peptide-methionine (S)-S-oxide reductase MsrA [Dyadobacter chenwenxiniae]MCF0065720.1 peptide-methionine (S)-S-oxide reductase MsrA [Dyadobacter chenwenxiniae]UON82037.1 peptide-methionine (S)-S-oxide reductase MsrA [Dyadobacter chenwenxiniae]
MNNEASSATLDENNVDMANTEIATFGTGCFWCTEAVLESLDGVKKVVSGYAGGSVANPSYKEVCTGNTGHAECVEVVYDPKVISYAELLEAFFRSHDPTSLNKQGNDVGTQYRSVIFYHNEAQQKLAEQAKAELDKSGAYSKPIVTEISKAPKFYVAEDYHQNYFANNPDQGYCAFVIAPKLDKFKKVFKEKLRKNI